MIGYTKYEALNDVSLRGSRWEDLKYQSNTRIGRTESRSLLSLTILENTVEQMEAIINPEDPEAGSYTIEF